MHVIAAKAVAFKEALTHEFRIYQELVVENARCWRPCCRSAACASSPAAPIRTCSWSTSGRRRSPARTPRQRCRRAYHRQQERDPERSRKAVRHQRHPHRQPGDHDARLHRDRMRAARAPDRRRARRADRHGARRDRRRQDAALDADGEGFRVFTGRHEVPFLRQRRYAGGRLARFRGRRFDPPPPPLSRMPEALHDLRDGRAAAAADRQAERHAFRFRRAPHSQRLPARAAQAAGADRVRRPGGRADRPAGAGAGRARDSIRARSARW